MKRLLKELREIEKQPNPHVFIEPSDSLQTLKASISGIQGPYSQAKFNLLVNVSSEYPLKPPSIKFTTTICHPNVNFDTGEICLDLLQNGWSPQWTIVGCLEAIRMLLVEPNFYSPLNCDAANLLKVGDIRGYNSLVRHYVLKFACFD